MKHQQELLEHQRKLSGTAGAGAGEAAPGAVAAAAEEQGEGQKRVSVRGGRRAAARAPSPHTCPHSAIAWDPGPRAKPASGATPPVCFWSPQL